MHSILNLSMTHYLILSSIIVGIGVMGIFINSRNVLMTLMSIELILLGVNFNFVIFARYLNDIHGQIFVFFVLTVAAVESAIGLAIIVLMYRIKKTIRTQDIDNLKG